MENNSTKMDEALSTDSDAGLLSSARERFPFEESEFERLQIHNAALREYVRSLVQIRIIRLIGTIIAGSIPIVLLIVLYVALLGGNLPEKAMPYLTIGTFTSFVVIYGIMLTGWYRITHLGYPLSLVENENKGMKQLVRELSRPNHGKNTEERER